MNIKVILATLVIMIINSRSISRRCSKFSKENVNCKNINNALPSVSLFHRCHAHGDHGRLGSHLPGFLRQGRHQLHNTPPPKRRDRSSGRGFESRLEIRSRRLRIHLCARTHHLLIFQVHRGHFQQSRGRSFRKRPDQQADLSREARHAHQAVSGQVDMREDETLGWIQQWCCDDQQGFKRWWTLWGMSVDYRWTLAKHITDRTQKCNVIFGNWYSMINFQH